MAAAPAATSATPPASLDDDGEGRPRHDPDRRDASGHGSARMKKEGAGKGGWGTSADAAGAEDADEAAGKADAKDEAADGEEENGEPAEPEVSTVSYEDFEGAGGEEGRAQHQEGRHHRRGDLRRHEGCGQGPDRG